MKVTMIKGEDVKFADAENVDMLKEHGWKVEGEEADDVEALREKAKELGITVHHKAGAAKIKELIAEKEGE